MKGTAPRGRWPEEDQQLAAGLAASAKERAENLMIVDLLRNDLGKIAVTGSVGAEPLFSVESYPTVHQMTSTVTARLKEGTGFSDILRALFPCGSVTGAPKRRSMAIIAAAEKAPRGVYCGTIGCLAPGGEMLFSVAIRTLVLDKASGRIDLGVGSGITWDSRPEAEYAESLSKSAFASPGRPFRLIETMGECGGVIPRLERHLERLAASAARFGYPFDRERVADLLAELPITAQLGRVRLTLGVDGGLDMSAEPCLSDDRPLRVGVVRTAADPADHLLYHKTDRRERLEVARQQRPDCDEVLLVNNRGELTEGSYHNLVLRLAGRLVTPHLESGLLPGVMRAELLERGEISEQTLYPRDLEQAAEIWLINSLRGWRRAVMVKET
jgi:para-aminobenzoate synthetase/4-amino-4-deoxychorismate lyase